MPDDWLLHGPGLARAPSSTLGQPEEAGRTREVLLGQREVPVIVDAVVDGDRGLDLAVLLGQHDRGGSRAGRYESDDGGGEGVEGEHVTRTHGGLLRLAWVGAGKRSQIIPRLPRRRHAFVSPPRARRARRRGASIGQMLRRGGTGLDQLVHRAGAGDDDAVDQVSPA